MKKSVRTLIGASIAAVLGSTLLLGGAGTLAFWSDTSSSAAQQIQSGQLDLGTIGATNIDAKIVQRTDGKTNIGQPVQYNGGPIVPGDVIIATVNIPVTLVGNNMKAKFTISPTDLAVASTDPLIEAKNVAMANALSMTVVRIGDPGFPLVPVAGATPGQSTTLTPASLKDAKVVNGVKVIPVVVEIAFPWGTPGQYNDTMGGQVKLSANYSLTQVAK